MRIRSFFVLLSAFVYLSDHSVMAADDEANESVTLHIDCKTNEITIAGFRAVVDQLLAAATPLEIIRQKKQLTEEQNNQLFQLQKAITEHLIMLSRYQYAQFYCDHPELLEQENQPPPIDPASLA